MYDMVKEPSHATVPLKRAEQIQQVLYIVHLFYSLWKSGRVEWKGKKTHLATALMVTFIEVCTVAIASQKRGTQDRNALIKLHSSPA
jgi:hypothetical protein